MSCIAMFILLIAQVEAINSCPCNLSGAYLSFAAAAAGVINFHTRSGIHDLCHDETHFSWRIELSSALSASFCEFAYQALITAPDNIWFHIIQSQSLFWNFFNEFTQSIIINITLPVGGSVKVNTVNDFVYAREGIRTPELLRD